MSNPKFETEYLRLQLKFNQACNTMVRHLYGAASDKKTDAVHGFDLVAMAIDDAVMCLAEIMTGAQGAPLTAYIKQQDARVASSRAARDEASLEEALVKRCNAQYLLYANAADQKEAGEFYLCSQETNPISFQAAARHMSLTSSSRVKPSVGATREELRTRSQQAVDANVARAREMHVSAVVAAATKQPEQTPNTAADATADTAPLIGHASHLFTMYSFVEYCDSLAFDLYSMYHCMDKSRTSLHFQESKERPQLSMLFEARLAAHYIHLLHATGAHRWSPRVAPLVNALTTLLLIKLLRMMPEDSSPPFVISEYIYQYIPQETLVPEFASLKHKRRVLSPPRALFARASREHWLLSSLEESPSAWFNLKNVAFDSRVRWCFLEPINGAYDRMTDHLKRAHAFLRTQKQYPAEKKAVECMREMLLGSESKRNKRNAAASAEKEEEDALPIQYANVNDMVSAWKKEVSMWAPEPLRRCVSHLQSKEGAFQVTQIKDRTAVTALHPITALLTMLQHITCDRVGSEQEFMLAFIKQQSLLFAVSK